MKSRILTTLLVLLFSGLIFAQATAPTGLTGIVENWGVRNYVKLTWEHELNSPQVQFEIYKKVSDDTEYTLVNNHWFRKDFKDFFVETGKTYSYYVVAKTPDYISAPSDIVTVTIEEPVVLKGTITGVVTDETT